MRNVWGYSCPRPSGTYAGTNFEMETSPACFPRCAHNEDPYRALRALRFSTLSRGRRPFSSGENAAGRGGTHVTRRNLRWRDAFVKGPGPWVTVLQVGVCVCVCACAREGEQERITLTHAHAYIQRSNISNPHDDKTNICAIATSGGGGDGDLRRRARRVRSASLR